MSQERGLGLRLPTRIIVILAIALGLQPLPAQQPAKPHWTVSYSHRDTQTSLSLGEIRFADATHGVAVGRLGKPAEPVALVTADGGASWNLIRLKSYARSLFFLGVENGWMTAADGLWKSIDGGKSFKKISGRHLGRVYFLDTQRGFAVGSDARQLTFGTQYDSLSATPAGKSPLRREVEVQVPTQQLLETRDGGVTWKEHPVSKRLGGAAVRSIDFAGKHGVAMGGMQRSGAVQSDGRTSTVRVIAETGDGGDTWTVSRLTLPGLTCSYRLAPGGVGYALTSELYRIEAEPTLATRVFAHPDLVAADVAVLADGSIWLATIGRAPAGKWVATEVRMLHSTSGSGFTETAIGSAVKAKFVALTKAPGGGMWAVTDTGIILKLN